MPRNGNEPFMESSRTFLLGVSANTESEMYTSTFSTINIVYICAALAFFIIACVCGYIVYRRRRLRGLQTANAMPHNVPTYAAGQSIHGGGPVMGYPSGMQPGVVLESNGVPAGSSIPAVYQQNVYYGDYTSGNTNGGAAGVCYGAPPNATNDIQTTSAGYTGYESSPPYPEPAMTSNPYMSSPVYQGIHSGGGTTHGTAPGYTGSPSSIQVNPL